MKQKFLGFAVVNLRHEQPDRPGTAAVCKRLPDLKSVKISAMNDIRIDVIGAGLAGGGSAADS